MSLGVEIKSMNILLVANEDKVMKYCARTFKL